MEVRPGDRFIIQAPHYRDCRVLTDDAALTQARLWLAEGCRIGLANALGLLGVGAPDEMARVDDEGDAAP